MVGKQYSPMILLVRPNQALPAREKLDFAYSAQQARLVQKNESRVA